MPSSLAVRRELVGGGEEFVANLLLSDTVGAALADAGITPQFLIGELAGILKTNRLTVDDKGNERFLVPPRDRLAAAKMLLEVAERSAHVSGLIEKLTGHAEKTLPDGTRLTMDAERLKLFEAGSDRTLRTLDLLEHASGVTNIIDLEDEDVRVVESGSGRDDGSGVQRPTSLDRGCERGEPADGGSRCGHDSGGGSDARGETDVEERAVETQSGTPKTDDQGTIQGAGDERSDGVSEQFGGGGKNKVTGEESGGPRVGHSGDSESAEWWNECRSPAVVLSPARPVVPVPVVPGDLAAKGRAARAGNTASVETPRSHRDADDDEPSDTRSARGISDRLRTLYLKTHPIEPGDDRSGEPSGVG